ncbi:hypothetical protein [Rhodanobacter ginsenosidimutans]|uniref:DUF2069 domain-containing protein n=1 Tax=Rhodanobacter ginsenosidimutans TaxID=490571 RepID=A0ABW0K043_9GAMM
MSQPPFYPRRIQLTVAFQMLALATIAYVSLSTTYSAYPLAIPILTVIAVLGMKWAAPKLPPGQAALVGLTVLAIHFLLDWIITALGQPLLIYLGDLIVSVVCVGYFGSRWVKQGYIPSASNFWP